MRCMPSVHDMATASPPPMGAKLTLAPHLRCGHKSCSTMKHPCAAPVSSWRRPMHHFTWDVDRFPPQHHAKQFMLCWHMRSSLLHQNQAVSVSESSLATCRGTMDQASSAQCLQPFAHACALGFAPCGARGYGAPTSYHELVCMGLLACMSPPICLACG